MPETSANTHINSIIHAVLRLLRVFEKSFIQNAIYVSPC